MSDFLVRLAARAAGLAPGAAPRPPDLLAGLLAPEPEVEEAPEAGLLAEPRSRVPSPAAPAAEQSARPAPAWAPASEAPPAARPPSPEPVVKPAPTRAAPAPPLAPREARVAAAEPAPRGAERVTDQSRPSAPVGPAMDQGMETNVSPPDPPRRTPRPIRPAARWQPKADAGGPPMGLRGIEATADRPVDWDPQPAPLPVVAAAPPPAPLAWPAEAARARAEEPGIQVRIGRIELVAPPPAAPEPQRPARAPRGFRDRGLSRRHLDRRWY